MPKLKDNILLKIIKDYDIIFMQMVNRQIFASNNYIANE